MLTRSGWGAIALAATAFVIGRVFGILELYVLGVGVVAALVVAIATMLRTPPRLVVRRLVEPSTVQAGDHARVDLQLANTGTRRSPVLQLWEPVGPTGGATMNLAPLRPRERATAAYRLPTAGRGVVRVGPMRARRRDVLGLATRTVLLPGAAELLVMPRHTPVRFELGGSSGRLGDHLRMRAYGQSGSEFHSLREYVVGDDLRRISWKASARSTDLIVKETALEGVKRCTVVLDTTGATTFGDARDTATTDGDASGDSSRAAADDSFETSFDPAFGAGSNPADLAFERAVSAAASLVTGAAATGLATRMVAPDVDLRGHEVAPVSLRWLATVQRGEGVSGQLPSLKAGEGLGVVLVVTSTPQSPLAAEVRAALGPDDTVVVVATESVSGRERFVLDATTDDAFVASWQQLTGSLATSRRLPAAYREPE
ncbi:MAG: DUF58 domain-containing protein [Actinobacteria bacterium]|jgi:uncharacterized protein (DUF58 family)|uniref:Unannotated protein n=1 Tax=freshwater metagenome TaxID=449393 RepID=A0A6J6GB89_9ZZZZ|nr:DUF58 domain-containing protein [Actinomycetota bacterium]